MLEEFHISNLIDYNAYLQSPHWKKVRKEACARANYRCQLCNRGGKLFGHHRTYENLWNEKPEDVIALCGECHSRFHKTITLFVDYALPKQKENSIQYSVEMTEEEFNYECKKIIESCKGPYINFDFSLNHYLGGDCNSSMIMSYIVDRLRDRLHNIEKIRKLIRSNMWFICRMSKIQKDLSFKYSKLKRSLQRLKQEQLIDTKYTKGNKLCVKINIEKVEEIHNQYRNSNFYE